MSNEESVAGINVRELLEEKQQLEEAVREAIRKLESFGGRYEVIDELKDALSPSEVPEKGEE